MGLTRAEQETVITWNDDAKEVAIWSASPVTWRKLDRLGIHPVRETLLQGKPAGKFYRLPFGLFRWGRRGKDRVGGNPDALRRAREAKQQTPEAPRGDEGTA
jgi:hypothetical protein